MTPLFKKLNYKDHRPILVHGAPESFAPEMEAMLKETAVVTTWPSTADKVPFAIGFALMQEQVDALAQNFADHTEGDAVLWVAYPKGSSKKYKCDFNRDTGWATLGEKGFEPVRQVAIDDDWSALRFRRVGFIKTMTRSFAMTEEGKRSTIKNRCPDADRPPVSPCRT
jgi:hypothetical protein